MKKLTILILLLVCFTNLLKAEEFLLKNNLGPHIKLLERSSSILDFKVVNNKVIALNMSGTVLRFNPFTGQKTGELIDSPGFQCLGDEYNGELLVGRRDGSIYSLNVDNFELTKLGEVNLPPLFILNVENNSQREVLAITHHRFFEFPKVNINKDDIIEENQSSNDKDISEDDSLYDDNAWYHQNVEEKGETIVNNITRNTRDTIKNSPGLSEISPPWKMFYSQKNKMIYFLTSIYDFGKIFACFDYINKEVKTFKNYAFANRFFETKSGDIYASCGSGMVMSETIYKLEGDSCRAVYNSPNSRIYRDNYSINHIEPDSLLGFKIPADIPYGFWDSLSRKYPTFPMNIIEENPGTNELLVYASRGIFASDTSFRKWRKVSDYNDAQTDSNKFKYYTDNGFTKNYRFSAGNYVALKPYDSLFIRTKDTTVSFGDSRGIVNYEYRKLICYDSGLLLYSGSEWEYYKDGKVTCYEDETFNQDLNDYYISLGWSLNCNVMFNVENDSLFLIKIADDSEKSKDEVDYKFIKTKINNFNPTTRVESPTNLLYSDTYFQNKKDLYFAISGNKVIIMKNWRLFDSCTIPLSKPRYHYNNYVSANIIMDSLPYLALLQKEEPNYSTIFRLKYSNKKGTAKIDIVDGKLKAELFYFVDKDTLTIYTGCAYKDKAVLFSNAGVYEYDFKNNKLKKFNIDLMDTNISECCIDKLGRIWICGDYLYRIDDIYNAKVERILNLRNEEITSLIPIDYGKGVYFYVLGRGAYIVEE